MARNAAPPDATTHARPVRDKDRLALRVVGDQLLELHPLPRVGDLVIGRGTEADIRIEDASISRKHALLSIGPVLRIKELGSANGTQVAGRALEAGEAAEIAPGEAIDLGSVMLIVVRVEPGAGAARPVPPGAGSEIDRVQRLLERVAPAEISILLQGETGVGKEVFAERIHARSGRAARPLLRLNCAGFTESLLDSELFGHQRGAFTGADKAKPGLLENADGGTVFLDEIGELPAGIQARLLRVLQDKKVQRVGALEPRAIDVRFVSASNRDLAEEVEQGRFRRDLYYRLNGVTLWIPPLRDRKPEIAGLARQFLAAANPALRLAPSALACLEHHDWPGNIRELKNVIERASLLVEPPGDEVTERELELVAPAPIARTASLHADVEALEKQRIVEALEACGGNQTRAAERLGMARGTLLTRLAKYGLKRPRG